MCVCVCAHACVRSVNFDSATPRTVARQAPLSMGFPSQEDWSRLPFPSPGDLPTPGVEPTPLVSPALQAGSLPLHHLGSLFQSSQQPRSLRKPHLCTSNGQGDPDSRGAALHIGSHSWEMGARRAAWGSELGLFTPDPRPFLQMLSSHTAGARGHLHCMGRFLFGYLESITSCKVVSKYRPLNWDVNVQMKPWIDQDFTLFRYG